MAKLVTMPKQAGDANANSKLVSNANSMLVRNANNNSKLISNSTLLLRDHAEIMLSFRSPAIFCNRICPRTVPRNKTKKYNASRLPVIHQDCQRSSLNA